MPFRDGFRNHDGALGDVPPNLRDETGYMWDVQGFLLLLVEDNEALQSL